MGCKVAAVAWMVVSILDAFKAKGKIKEKKKKEKKSWRLSYLTLRIIVYRAPTVCQNRHYKMGRPKWQLLMWVGSRGGRASSFFQVRFPEASLPLATLQPPSLGTDAGEGSPGRQSRGKPGALTCQRMSAKRVSETEVWFRTRKEEAGMRYEGPGQGGAKGGQNQK